MRYREFELTEDELFELKMSPTNLSKMAKNIDARVGMEFELIVPGFGDEEDEFESEPDYDADERFPTSRGWTRDVIDFFSGGTAGETEETIQRAIDSLNEDFYAWTDEDQEEYINSAAGQDRIREIVTDNVNRDDYESDEEYDLALQTYIDENEGDLRDQLIEEYNEDLDIKFEEWLEEQSIRSMADFGNEYNLDWPYWTEPDYYGSRGVSIDQIADDFGTALGVHVDSSSSYHGATRQPGRWVVEPDSSLHGDDGESGLEFVSPPMPVNEMLNDIEAVAKWARRVGAYTNDSTGLHMNVSVPDQQNLDFVKLAMFLGDNYILEQFGRAGNSYCKSILKQIVTTARSDPSRVEEMMRQFQGGLNQLASKVLHTGSTAKYSSINNRGKWIEFRSPGGNWLGEDLSLVKNTMLRAVVALDVATKPEEFKQEYYKKLVKTLQNPVEFTGARGERQQRVDKGADDAISVFAKYVAGELPQSELKTFVRQIQLKRNIEAGKTGGELYWWDVWRDGKGANGPGVQVVAKTQEEALTKAAKEFGLASPEYMPRATAHPLRPYDTSAVKATIGEPVPAGGVGGEQSSDANYEIYNGETNRVMFRFIANTDEEARRKFDDWIASANLSRAGFGWRRIENQDIQRRRQGAAAMPPINFDGNYEVYRVESGRTVYRFQADGVPEAYDMLQRWREYMMEPSLNPREFNVRAVQREDNAPAQPQSQVEQQFTVDYTISRDGNVRNNSTTLSALNANAAMTTVRNHLEDLGYTVDRIEAEPVPPQAWRDQLRNHIANTSTQGQGTESRLPPGNARWLVLDRNDNEVYSFVNTTAQSDANQYARDWMINRAPREVRDRGPFTIVPAR